MKVRHFLISPFIFFTGNNLPPIEEVPIKMILKMKACYQKSAGTYVGLDDAESGEEDAPKTSTSGDPRPTPIHALLPKSSQNVHRQVPDVVGSTVAVSYRLLKLKIELLNIVAILPKGLLSWSSDEKKKKEANDESHDSSDDPIDMADKENENALPPSPSPDAPISDPNESDMTTEKFIQEIQKCDTYGNLFKLIQLLEGALPRVALFDYPFHSSLDFTNAPLTSSIVATYLYSFDRWIRYEDIPLDFYYEGVNYRPRLVYTPRCALSPVCLKYFHHSGRCDPAISVGDSRFREILPKGMQVPNQSAKQLLTNQFQKFPPPPGMQQRPPQSLLYGSRPNIPYANLPIMRPEVGVFTLDSIQPYVPKKEEIKDSAWI